MEKSISFGVSFIFTFFLSGISGYYLGKLIFGFNEGLSMILAVIALIGTLIIESILFILKTWRNDKAHAKKILDEATAKEKLRNSHSSEISKLAFEFAKKKEQQETTASTKKNPT